MQTKKIISMGLLIIIIIITLVFSMIFTPVSKKEGLDVMQNPSDSDLKKITDILNDSTKDNITKIKEIYDTAKNYTLLLAIYTNLANDCLKNIRDYIKIAPIKDRNGTNVDVNSISKSQIEKISGILASNSEPPVKVFAIRDNICNDPDKCDKKLSSIYKNYENMWIDLLTKYVNQLNSDSGKQNKATAVALGTIN
jgi:hypothetical protein